MAAVRRIAALRALWQVLARRGDGTGTRDHLAALPRMLRWGFGGRYPYLDRGRLGLVLLALGYVLSPVDLVPELLLPLLGLGDDVVILAWAFGALLAETGSFLEWERARGRDRVIVSVVD